MKLLSDILYKSGIEEVIGDISRSIDSICFDSRKVTSNSLSTKYISSVCVSYHFLARLNELFSVVSHSTV